MVKLSNVLKRENNNFDLIRLIAAIAVIFGHSFTLFNTYGFNEPVKKLIGFDYSGSLAVHIFFFLSGVFITSSWFKSATVYRFVIMRLFRIWPALIVCVLITTFLIGPIISTYSVPQYFTSITTWKYVFKNTFFYPDVAFYLPGVFNKNHLPGPVNGSLWTLPTEVKCYLLILLLGLFSILKKTYTLIAVFTIFIFLYLTNNAYFIKPFYIAEAAKEVLFFFGGAVIYKLRDYIIVDYKIAIALVISCFILQRTVVFIPVFYVMLCYCVITAGASASLKKARLSGDYSYGTYIYGFLVQQIIADLYPSIPVYTGFLIAVVITLVFAIGSWHLIEHPANTFAKRLAAERVLSNAATSL